MSFHRAWSPRHTTLQKIVENESWKVNGGEIAQTYNLMFPVDTHLDTCSSYTTVVLILEHDFKYPGSLVKHRLLGPSSECLILRFGVGPKNLHF